MSNQTIVQEVKRLLSTGQRASISTKTFEKIIELLEQKEKALNKIQEYQQRNCETCVYANTQKCNVQCQVFVILDIINKEKAEYEV